MYNVDYYQNSISDAEYVPSVKFEKGKTPADLLNRINAIGKGDFTRSLIQDNKVATKGAIIGLVVGFMAAMYWKQNKILFSVAGVLSGAMIGTIINKYNKTQAEALAKIQEEAK
jgi:hypothetical protein